MNDELLTENEKFRIFHLFWERGSINWQHDTFYPNGGYHAPVGGYLAALNEHGNLVEIIYDPDEDNFKKRSRAAKDYADRLERGLRRMIEKLGEDDSP